MCHSRGVTNCLTSFSLPQSDEKVAIFRILAAILHLGNICFTGDTVSGGHRCKHSCTLYLLTSCSPTSPPSAPPPVHHLCLQKGGQDAVRVSAVEHLQSVGNLLGIPAKDLEVSVTNKVTFTRGELFYTPLTVDQALDTR